MWYAAIAGIYFIIKFVLAQMSEFGIDLNFTN